MNDLSLFPVIALIIPISFALLYPLRAVVLRAKTHSLFMRGISGALAWILTASVAIWFLAFGWHVILFLGGHHNDAGFAFFMFFYAVITGAVIKSFVRPPDVLDWGNMKDFIRRSLTFDDYFRDKEDLLHKLERFNIRKIYRETTGKTLPAQIQEENEITEARNLGEQRNTKSPLLQEKIDAVQKGEKTELTEAWKIHAMGLEFPLPLYEHVTRIDLDPAAQRMSLHVNIPGAEKQHLSDPVFLFRLKQELYILLQAINTDRWFNPLKRYYAGISVLCSATTLDAHGIPIWYPFLRIDIDVSELRKREGLVFTAGELHTIARMTFNNGEPIEERFSPPKPS